MVKGTEGKISAAVRVLRAGGVIVFPTDTAYGIGCDATDSRAVARVFRLKGRERGKAMPMIVSDLHMAKEHFRISDIELRISKRHWPGPLSLVLNAKRGIAPAALIAGTAAVRVPHSRIARSLARRLGRPIIATSANRSGLPPAYSTRQLTVTADYVLNAGALPRRKPSTIARVRPDGTVEVLRAGPVSVASTP